MNTLTTESPVTEGPVAENSVIEGSVAEGPVTEGVVRSRIDSLRLLSEALPKDMLEKLMQLPTCLYGTADGEALPLNEQIWPKQITIGGLKYAVDKVILDDGTVDFTIPPVDDQGDKDFTRADEDDCYNFIIDQEGRLGCEESSKMYKLDSEEIKLILEQILA
ncbi:MAG: hypothetical protein UR28_C0011G0018 [Candidatus Peregrinibacteria bacterium GW2011_GWF2_33_10]|nr:MAG: hypothetical protein UR28_C0011G0018 [Candidatus Peregrinibacteria bacterium GW2011_GWF2_33_10]OGJ44295.1 MAG: hypothetical protein A2272_05550 [Candidatus Peregrinibacteria bacterium RIFOXYA12_FULL_33_12]OGJ44670.1 MAG: hypothetical protein A2263_00990 [Candidatus Peregrinibacteria bacterium RIFOXYA2_FULL_33_21]OGJ50404.1 MAG: hypothetical protein A2307_06050 [Candidatus Peregrinibacteria bacterium RIFOXYB2_FULL_33_20]